MDVTRGEFTISTDQQRLDLVFIHHELSNSYWAAGIPFALVQQYIPHSLCFGIYHGQQQVGFARVITDYSTFGYLADVFVTAAYRGQGLSKWLMEVIMAHPGLQGLRRFMLATRDAHELYTKYGFVPLANPDRLMEIVRPDIYRNSANTETT